MPSGRAALCALESRISVRAAGRGVAFPAEPDAVPRVPSASALGLHGATIAHYNQYEVQRNDRGWEVEIATRRYQRDSGEFAAGETRILQLLRS